MNAIQPKTKELAIHHCGCHENLVIIAMRYMADAYCPKQPPYQVWTQYNFRERSWCHNTVVASYHSNEAYG